MNISKQFLENGYVILPCENLKPLLEIRKSIFELCQSIFDYNEDDIDYFYNNFHEIHSDRNDLNRQRIELINQCTQNLDINRNIFDAFPSALQELLGPDLLSQKNPNIVISKPNDPNNAELHRDATPNSFYELVAWVPMVDTYGSKTMYVLDVEKSDKVFRSLDSKTANWGELVKSAELEGARATVPFGSALFFWAGLFHGSEINREGLTRWTLNTRYKSAFAPVGLKDPFNFYKIFQLSSITKLAIEAEKREFV